MKIRVVLKYDVLSEIAGLHKKIFGEEFPQEDYAEKSKKHTIYRYVYYAEEDYGDREAIGYSLVINQPEEKDLYAWYGGLLPKYQGMGLMSQFFDFLSEKALQMGYKSISLATTNERPNMIRLAVKYGFDIVEVKQRSTGEGNKIYFKFFLHPPKEVTILINESGTKKSWAEIERILVKAHKSNCTKIYVAGVEDDEDMKLVKYVISYCKTFMRKIPIELRLFK